MRPYLEEAHSHYFLSQVGNWQKQTKLSWAQIDFFLYWVILKSSALLFWFLVLSNINNTLSNVYIQLFRTFRHSVITVIVHCKMFSLIWGLIFNIHENKRLPVPQGWTMASGTILQTLSHTITWIKSWLLMVIYWSPEDR